MLKSGLFLMIMATAAAAQPPSDDNIRGILKQRIDNYHQGVGIVAEMIDPNGRKVVGCRSNTAREWYLGFHSITSRFWTPPGHLSDIAVFAPLSEANPFERHRSTGVSMFAALISEETVSLMLKESIRFLTACEYPVCNDWHVYTDRSSRLFEIGNVNSSGAPA